MSVKIKIPITLQSATDGKKYVYTRPGKLSSILKEISYKYPTLAKKIMDKGFVLKPGINIFLDDKENQYFLKFEDKISNNQKIIILATMSGG